MRLHERSGAMARVGNTSGSAFCVRREGSESYWVSNAHVWSTQVGRVVQLVLVDRSGVPRTFSGTIVAAGYRSGAAVDWAVATFELPGDVQFDVHPLANRSSDRGWLTVGSPRAERPSCRRLGPLDRFGNVIGGPPAAIGGQSGSGAGDDSRTHGLVTWTDGARTLMQSAEALRQTMRPEWFEDDGGPEPCRDAWALPEGLIPVCEGPPQACSDGFFGDVGIAQVAFGGDGGGVESPLSPWLELLLLLLPVILEWLGRRDRVALERVHGAVQSAYGQAFWTRV